MELDELKEAWKHTPTDNTTNTDIMELIQHKSYGPVAALKKTYRKQMIAMALVPLVLFFANAQQPEAVLSSVLFWSYAAFCAGMILLARYNLRIVRSLEVLDGPVKATLQRQVSLLEKRARLELLALRGVIVFFIVLIEVVPYFQHYRMLDKWHALPLPVRLGTYAALVVVQYFLNRKIKQRKVGRHLAHLKALANELH